MNELTRLIAAFLLFQSRLEQIVIGSQQSHVQSEQTVQGFGSASALLQERLYHHGTVLEQVEIGAHMITVMGYTLE